MFKIGQKVVCVNDDAKKFCVPGFNYKGMEILRSILVEQKENA